MAGGGGGREGVICTAELDMAASTSAWFACAVPFWVARRFGVRFGTTGVEHVCLRAKWIASESGDGSSIRNPGIRSVKSPSDDEDEDPALLTSSKCAAALVDGDAE